MGTARMKKDKERKEDKKRCMSLERSKTQEVNEISKEKTLAQAYLPLGLLSPETADEFPN